LLLLNKQLNIKVQLDCKPAVLHVDCLHNYGNYSRSTLVENGKF